MSKRKINVRKHPRRLPSGEITSVKRHSREIEKIEISKSDKIRIKEGRSHALISKKERRKELNETIRLLDGALKQLEIAEKERKLNPPQRKRRDELKRRKRNALEEFDKISVKSRTARKRRYKAQLEEMRRFESEKQKEEEIKNLIINVDKKKIALTEHKREFERVKQKHQRIFQGISEVSNKEWNEHKYDYPEYKDWTYPEEIELRKSFETGGELHKKYRTAYDNYYLNKQSVENLEEKLVLLKKGEKKKGMFETEKKRIELENEIVQLRNLIKTYKSKNMDPDYVKAKEVRLQKLKLQYNKLTI